MKSTEAKPGKPYVMKLRDDEEELFKKWLDMQSMYSDSIRYLIQKEIAENGLRNLQLHIPQFRTIDSIKAQLTSVATNQAYGAPGSSYSHMPAISPPPQPQFGGETAQETNMRSHEFHKSQMTSEKATSPENQVKPISLDNRDPIVPSDTSDVLIRQTTDETQLRTVTQDIATAENDPALSGKKKAGKTFSDDVTNSYAN